MAVKIFPSVNDVAPVAGDGITIKEANLVSLLKTFINKAFVISGLTVPASSVDLTLSVALGEAFILGYWVKLDAATSVTCADNTTNHIYLKLTKDGGGNVTGATFEVNTTGTPPSDSVKIATAATSVGAVTITTDERVFNPIAYEDEANTFTQDQTIQTGITPSLKLRDTALGVAAGGLWRTAITGGVLYLQNNTAAEGDFSTANHLAIDNTGKMIAGAVPLARIGVTGTVTLVSVAAGNIQLASVNPGFGDVDFVISATMENSSGNIAHSGACINTQRVGRQRTVGYFADTSGVANASALASNGAVAGKNMDTSTRNLSFYWIAIGR